MLLYPSSLLVIILVTMSSEQDPDFITPPTTGAIARRPTYALDTTVVTNALVCVKTPVIVVNLYQLGTTLHKDDVIYDICNPQKGLISLGGYAKI